MKLSFIIPIIFLIISPFAAYADNVNDAHSQKPPNHHTNFTSTISPKTTFLEV